MITSTEEKKDRKLTDFQALILLFTVAIMPSNLISEPIIFKDRKCAMDWVGAFMGIIVFSFLLNFVTLNILNRVASVKQMDSYQEVAYNISNSNRGYIFLISAAKFIFLTVTVAFAVNYCANYLTYLSLLGRSETLPKPGEIWGIYFAYVILVGSVLFIPFYKMRNVESSKGPENLNMYAYIFGACGIVALLIAIATMWAAFI